MQTIYVTDLDGTLLNSRTQLSETARKLLRELIDKGMNFTYATARSRNSAKRLLGDLTITLPVIVHNGVFVMEAASGTPLFSCRFSEAEAALLSDLARRLPYTPLL
ncbi:MAG: HAD family hydrolase, partial [Clostridiales bacterium]|nr:HAD family hydrolase [Clostridiales bacterium]